MNALTLLCGTLALALAAYALAWRRAKRLWLARDRGERRSSRSMPSHFAVLSALWCGLPALGLLLVWTPLSEIWIDRAVRAQLPAAAERRSAAERELSMHVVRAMAASLTRPQDAETPAAPALGTPDAALEPLARSMARMRARSDGLRGMLVGCLATLGLFWGWRLSGLRMLPAHRRVERALHWAMLTCSAIAVLTTLGIVLSVLFESLRFFSMVSPIDYLFGLEWSTQMAIREGQVGAAGSFGAVPVFLGTAVIAAIAMLLAAPVGLFSAIYLTEYASRHVQAVFKPTLEILAGIPTVVYGVFAALTVAPLIQGFGAGLGWEVSAESSLAAGLVMGIMIIPFVCSLSNDALNAVPQDLTNASLSLGSTRSEAVRRVMLPAALPGIAAGMLLAVSRAIGETMIVVMASGLAAKLTLNPLDSHTTVTAQIVSLLVGDQAFDSPKTLAAFALGLTLFLVTLGLNLVALIIVRRYREQYE